jgi:O-antigen ligase
VSSLVFIVLSLVTFCVLRVRGKKTASDGSGKQGSEKGRGLAFLKDFRASWPVWMLIIFWVNTLISTLQSEFLYESVWGNEGRYTGLFLISIYTVTTLLLVFFSEPKRWYLDAFLFTSCIVEILGILDYGGLDLLQFGRFGEQVGEMKIFTSTIGNVNFYTSFLSFGVAVAVVYCVAEKNSRRQFVYTLLTVIAYTALILGQSDSAYLTIGCLFALLPFAFFRNRKGVSRVAVQYVLFAWIMCFLGFLNDVFRTVAADGGILLAVGGSLGFRILTLLMTGMAVGLYLWQKKESSQKVGNPQDAAMMKRLRLVWGGLVLAAFLIVAFILYDANALGHADRYAALRRYVLFNDDWGTERGFAWRVGLTAWWQQPLIHKLFGYGPETFGILTWEYRKASTNAYGIIFDSMHNEYLQNLVTMGPVGMLSYLGLIIGSVIVIWKTAKSAEEKTWLFAAAFAIACYGTQAMVNISMPIVAPVMWVLIGLGLSAVREAAHGAEEKEK